MRVWTGLVTLGCRMPAAASRTQKARVLSRDNTAPGKCSSLCIYVHGARSDVGEIRCNLACKGSERAECSRQGIVTRERNGTPGSLKNRKELHVF